jgi:cyclophilin family peptidyl-prolyl cis-trans isomerase
MRFFTTLIAALTFAGSLWAADPENTLMIEVAGLHPGIVEIELLPDVAPKHVARIKQLTRDGAYNNVAFHRVLANFMAQTGDVKYGRMDSYNMRFAGTGDSKYPNLPAEFSDLPFKKGTVGMPRGQSPDSANAQFFIMFNDYPPLNNNYTVFGRVISGQKVVDQIKKGSQAANGAVTSPDYMKKVWIKSDQ